MLPAGVCALFVSTMNNQASDASIWLRIVVLLQAVNVLPFIPIPAIIHQELSAIVVVLVENDVDVTGQVELDESGCPDCSTQLYDTHFDIIPQFQLAVTTILFVQLVGFTSCQKYNLELLLFCNTDCTWVIATQLYVTQVIVVKLLFAVATYKIPLDQEQVWEYVRDDTHDTNQLVVVESKEIAILFC